MVGLGALAIFSVVVFLRETTIPDKSLIRPRRLLSAYQTLLSAPRFLLAALVLGGSIGALYAQATMLTFILINEVGMTPTAFGVGMLMQTGAYFFGSIALRYIAPRLGDRRSVVLGLCFSATGGLLILLSVFLIPPSFLSIMGPVAVATVGIALLTPSMVTAALAPFPHIRRLGIGNDGLHSDGIWFCGRYCSLAYRFTTHRLRHHHSGDGVHGRCQLYRLPHRFQKRDIKKPMRRHRPRVSLFPFQQNYLLRLRLASVRRRSALSLMKPAASF